MLWKRGLLSSTPSTVKAPTPGAGRPPGVTIQMHRENLPTARSRSSRSFFALLAANMRARGPVGAFCCPDVTVKPGPNDIDGATSNSWNFPRIPRVHSRTVARAARP
jgi:hypothetical protein